MLNDAQVPASRTRISEPDSTVTRVWFRFFESVYQYITKGFGVFYSTVDQTAAANTPTVVSFDSAGTARSIAIATDATRIAVSREGVYNIIASVQLENAHTQDMIVSNIQCSWCPDLHYPATTY